MIKKSGFTLIELLVTMGIIALLVGIAAFALVGSQKSGRDAKRKADLEQVRASLELYRSSCNTYPSSLSFGGSLTGTGSPASCTGTFMKVIPDDISADRNYVYTYDASANDYDICAALEEAPIPAVNMSNYDCGTGCGVTCNYAITSP